MRNYPFPDTHGRSLAGSQGDRYAVRDRHGSTKVTSNERSAPPKERTVKVRITEGQPSVKVVAKSR